MRVLQLDKKFPYPPRDGGSIATLNISRALAGLGHDVTILAMNTEKHHFDPSSIPEEISKAIDFHAVDIDTAVHTFAALWALIRNRSYNVERFRSREYERELRRILNSHGPFDVIQLEGLYLAPYIDVIREESKSLIALRAHNVEHLIWERRADTTAGLLKRTYLKTLAHQLRRYEIETLNRVDALVPISPVDAREFQRLGCKRPIHVCPASFCEETVTPGNASPPHESIFFLGALDWSPNLDGLAWFMNDVWPQVLRQHPDLVLHIAGRNMPDSIRALQSKNITTYGEVEDAYEYMRNFNLMIVPLLSGSGMRVKIIEGMALGKVIISTTIGVEGIEGTPGEHYLVADTPDQFAQQIIDALSQPTTHCRELSANALTFARNHYGSRETTHELVGFYEGLLTRG
ncbi:MAG: glycosyltransferase family 4 protein [Planctomycetaceae bacterium]